MAKKYGSLGFLGWGMFINSIFGFLVPISAHVSSWGTLNHFWNIYANIFSFTYLVGSWMADSSAIHSRIGRGTDCALHSCPSGEMDSSSRTIENGRACVRWRSVRNHHLNADFRITGRNFMAVDLLRLWSSRRCVELSIFVDRVWGSTVESEDKREGEKVY